MYRMEELVPPVHCTSISTRQCMEGGGGNWKKSYGVQDASDFYAMQSIRQQQRQQPPLQKKKKKQTHTTKKRKNKTHQRKK